jgi:hypothetical protein
MHANAIVAFVTPWSFRRPHDFHVYPTPAVCFVRCKCCIDIEWHHRRYFLILFFPHFLFSLGQICRFGLLRANNHPLFDISGVFQEGDQQLSFHFGDIMCYQVIERYAVCG